LAEQYRTGTGVQRDPARAVELYRQAAEQGNAAAQMRLGQAYLLSIGLPRDVTAALGWLRAAARQENAEALFILSGVYATGEGVERDDDFAWQLGQRAAALGEPRAAATVGSRFLYDASVRDVPKGLHYLHESAQANEPLAAYLLGLEYLRGTHVPRDPGSSVHWMSQAARSRIPAASLLLSVLYAKGIGVEPDAARAAELLDAGLAKATPSEQNSFAWTLATDADGELRDGALAVRIMEQLTAEPSQRSAAYLDTLAAAYAEAGQFDAAVRAQTQAIEALRPTVTAAQREDYEGRRALYQGRNPYLEPQ
ncbi:MAG TPA: tetratricopeptide repeat protein, partial [Gammaproteobacteria bacterium]|nr:tetratricopeptide repeat protein [Gammaproteobacteria bacterium]